RTDRTVGLAPGKVDPHARVIVQLLRERRRPLPVDAAEAYPALEPPGGAGQASKQRALEAERDGPDGKPARRSRPAPAAGPEAEEATRFEKAIQVYHPVACPTAAMVRDDCDTRRLTRGGHESPDGGVERPVDPRDRTGMRSRGVPR